MDEHGYNWKTVKEAFEKAGLTEDDAYRNARLARILTCEDYDYKTEQPILWCPSDAHNGTDNGAGSKDEADRGRSKK